ncbi:progranulin-like [Dunckerocampus dactyliophorus]|uniref:progranulin-like n=1 Tax=Dunckerocampus dactyliophorus TaxID=161453 RepID=UPI0024058887|nr:progranulin-like [Dunckerocampus dactyliophorus]
MQRLAVFCWAVLVLVHAQEGKEGDKLTSSYKCRPSDQGIPCADGKRCCLEGHRCSADGLWCIKKELPSVIICPDGVSECPDASTCCANPEGRWGCCPVPQAVCCEDKVHCCPEGTLCDVQHSKCVSQSSGEDMPMWDKLPARRRDDWENQKANSVRCNEKVSCQDDNTCCKNQEGGWSCCPLPEAVCCTDLQHCCPKGYTCNTAARTCDMDLGSVPWLRKVPAIPKQDAHERDVVCDDTHTCEEDSTCCKTPAGEWECCPLPQAVCCPDGQHCCPHHYKCDEQRAKCVQEGAAIPWYTKLPSVSFVSPPQAPVWTLRPQYVQCDNKSMCEDGQTCCKTSPTDWGCCPLHNAVCCSDMIHCCPPSYTCTAGGKCIQNPALL